MEMDTFLFNLFVQFALQCLNATQLLRYYGLEASSLISPELFVYICPALLYQIERRLCIGHYDELEDFTRNKNASIENKDKTGASGGYLFLSWTEVVHVFISKLESCSYFGTKFLNKFDLYILIQE